MEPIEQQVADVLADRYAALGAHGNGVERDLAVEIVRLRADADRHGKVVQGLLTERNAALAMARDARAKADELQALIDAWAAEFRAAVDAFNGRHGDHSEDQKARLHFAREALLAVAVPRGGARAEIERTLLGGHHHGAELRGIEGDPNVRGTDRG